MLWLCLITTFILLCYGIYQIRKRIKPPKPHSDIENSHYMSLLKSRSEAYKAFRKEKDQKF